MVVVSFIKRMQVNWNYSIAIRSKFLVREMRTYWTLWAESLLYQNPKFNRQSIKHEVKQHHFHLTLNRERYVSILQKTNHIHAMDSIGRAYVPSVPTISWLLKLSMGKTKKLKFLILTATMTFGLRSTVYTSYAIPLLL